MSGKKRRRERCERCESRLGSICSSNATEEREQRLKRAREQPSEFRGKSDSESFSHARCGCGGRMDRTSNHSLLSDSHERNHQPCYLSFTFHHPFAFTDTLATSAFVGTGRAADSGIDSIASCPTSYRNTLHQSKVGISLPILSSPLGCTESSTHHLVLNTIQYGSQRLNDSIQTIHTPFGNCMP